MRALSPATARFLRANPAFGGRFHQFQPSLCSLKPPIIPPPRGPTDPMGVCARGWPATWVGRAAWPPLRGSPESGHADGWRRPPPPTEGGGEGARGGTPSSAPLRRPPKASFLWWQPKVGTTGGAANGRYVHWKATRPQMKRCGRVASCQRLQVVVAHSADAKFFAHHRRAGPGRECVCAWRMDLARDARGVARDAR